jgi:cardiolipin synthase C
VTAVFAAYAPYRLALARSGVQLYEVRPDAIGRGQAKKHKLAFGSSAASLHTKSIVFDGAKAFVGSMNLDPRSQRWNTEVGVLVESAELAQQILSVAKLAMRPGNTYHVIADSGRLVWVYEDKGQEKRSTTEPASAWRGFKANVMSWMLPQELL